MNEPEQQIPPPIDVLRYFPGGKNAVKPTQVQTTAEDGALYTAVAGLLLPMLWIICAGHGAISWIGVIASTSVAIASIALAARRSPDKESFNRGARICFAIVLLVYASLGILLLAINF